MRWLPRASLAGPVIAALAAVASPSSARSPLVIDIESPVIEISVSFVGTEILLFGAIDGGGDVAVVVSGSRRTEIVRRKTRVAGIWINAHSRAFQSVPAYYHVAATRPLDEIAPKTLLRRHQFGPERVRFGYAPGQDARDRQVFREALIRNKRRAGLYSAAEGKVAVLDGRLFRATFTFPANVPTGTYKVDVYLIRDGKIVSTRERELSISKVGLEAGIFNFAHRQSALYGIIAIVIALLAGWSAGAVFRRA